MMNCRETRPLIPLFLDGELEARQMRAVALHSTRCSECEQELSQLERLQETISTQIAAEVDAIDAGLVWEGVAARIDTVTIPWHRRLGDWWQSVRPVWRPLVPISAAALAVACVLAVVLWQGRQPASLEPPAQVAAVDNSAILDSVQSNVGNVALLREPETNTMVLWINDNEPAGAEDFGDLP
jgi:anti-sigma factor RsiW